MLRSLLVAVFVIVAVGGIEKEEEEEAEAVRRAPRHWRACQGLGRRRRICYCCFRMLLVALMRWLLVLPPFEEMQ